MPGIKALVAAISNEVVSQLATAGYPALTDGSILLGRQFQFEESAPPRIIFTPASSDFPMKDVYNASPSANGRAYTAEQLAQIRNPAFRTDRITFEVRCWGVSPDQDPIDDFDYTQTLYQSVIRVVHELTNGSYEIGKGNWTDATFSAGQIVRDGREFVFSLTLDTPILSRLEAMPAAPNDTRAQNTTNLELPTGQSNVGCSD